MEKIKRSDERVALERLAPEHTQAPQVTGGYLLKVASDLDSDERSFYAGDLGIGYQYPDGLEMETRATGTAGELHPRLFQCVLRGPDRAESREPDDRLSGVCGCGIVDRSSFVERDHLERGCAAAERLLLSRTATRRSRWARSGISTGRWAPRGEGTRARSTRGTGGGRVGMKGRTFSTRTRNLLEPMVWPVVSADRLLATVCGPLPGIATGAVCRMGRSMRWMDGLAAQLREAQTARSLAVVGHAAAHRSGAPPMVTRTLSRGPTRARSIS